MMTPEDHRDQHWDEDNEPEKMSLSDAISIVDDYLVFNQEHDNFKEALQIVSEAAEDYNYFANGESRQSYRAKLTGLQSRARQEGRNENRTYIEKQICEEHAVTIYGDYEPTNELLIRFDKSGQAVRMRKLNVMPNHDTTIDALFDEAVDDLQSKVTSGNFFPTRKETE